MVLGLDGEAEIELDDALAQASGRAVALVMGAEGPGLRDKTKETVDKLVKIPFARGFGSLNVSNATAIAPLCGVQALTPAGRETREVHGEDGNGRGDHESATGSFLTGNRAYLY